MGAVNGTEHGPVSVQAGRSAILLSYGLLVIGNGLLITLLTVRGSQEGLSTATLGAVMSAHFLGMLIGAFRARTVVSQVGHIRAFAAFASVMSTAALLHLWWVNPYAWAVLRLMTGFCMAGLVMVTESWLNAATDNRRRGGLLAIYMIVNYGCSGSGQLLLGVADTQSFHLFTLASILYSLALVPLLLTRAPAPPAPGGGRIDYRSLLRLSPLGFVVAFCSGVMNASWHSLGPLYAASLGGGVEDISRFMAVGVFAGLLLQWPMGRWSDRVGRQRVLALCAVVAAAAALMMQGQWWQIAVYGAFAYPLYSLCAAHVNDLGAQLGKTVEVASGLLVMFGIGSFLGPLLIGYLMDAYQPDALFWALSVMAGIVTVMPWVLGSRISGRKRREFVPVPGEQLSTSEIYSAARQDRAVASTSKDES